MNGWHQQNGRQKGKKQWTWNRKIKVIQSERNSTKKKVGLRGPVR